MGGIRGNAYPGSFPRLAERKSSGPTVAHAAKRIAIEVRTSEGHLRAAAGTDAIHGMHPIPSTST